MSRVDRLFVWLETRPTRKELWRMFRALFLLEVVWVGVVLTGIFTIQNAFGLERPASKLTPFFNDMNLTKSLVFVVIAPVIEECAFRFAPFTVAFGLVKLGLHQKLTIVAAVLFSAFGFAIAHVFNYESTHAGTLLMTILIQGMGGLIASLLFLKYSGMRLRYVFGALGVTALYHILWNGMILTPVIITM